MNLDAIRRRDWHHWSYADENGTLVETGVVLTRSELRYLIAEAERVAELTERNIELAAHTTMLRETVVAVNERLARCEAANEVFECRIDPQ